MAEISRHAEEARLDPALLACPVRVVVPSRSLRDHLTRALAREHGALAGVSIHTLYGLALDVLERSGGGAPKREALFPVLVRRAAREESALRERFDSLAQGYGVVEAVVADLLDSGFDTSHEAPVQELLLERLAPGDALEVAQAVVRSTARTQQSMHRYGVEHRSLVLRWARTLIEQDVKAVLPARAVLIHGFADATGTASDLLAALVSQCPATILFDAPPEPGDATQASVSGLRFNERLRARFEGLLPVVEELPSPAEASEPVLALVAAPGASAEVRAVAQRVRSALDRGTAPESIAVVARDPADYALAIRIHFTRLGIPFSGSGLVGPAGRNARRIAALLALLKLGPEVELEDWLDALGSALLADFPGGSAKSLSDFRLAVNSLGLRSLAELAARELPSVDLPLPTRLGLRLDADSGTPYAPHSRLSACALRKLIEAARATCDEWGAGVGVPGPAPLCEQLKQLAQLLYSSLGWADERGRAGRAEGDPKADLSLGRQTTCEINVSRVLARLTDELPMDLLSSRDELCALLDRELATAAEEAIGGLGGGVQILGVMEARSRCFDELFVLGLNRDSFPRAVREDPLLPDALRQQLCVLLPELPVKRRGYDEERHLFAQLLAASPRVTVSWQYTSDDGRERAPSTLLERLRWARPDLEIERISVQPTLLPSADDCDRPAWEHAVSAALHGTPRERRASLEAALRERRLALADASAGDDDAITRLADAREEVLREMDRPPASKPTLGPYLGLVGPIRSEADPRRLAPFVTSLERSASCGWRFFLENLLRLESSPDPGDALPEIGALDVGSVVHSVLEQIVKEARPSECDSDGFSVPWPAESRLRQLVRDACAVRLEEAAIDSPALTGILCEFVGPLLERARELDWSQGALRVLAVERHGEVTIPTAEGEAALPPIRFIADRVDPPADAASGPVLTDYKTGAAISNAVKAPTRRKHLLDSVRTGRHLQAAAYACSSGGSTASGRYLQLAVENPEAAAASVPGSDLEFVEAFHAAGRALLGAWNQGSFAPQLVAPARGAASPCSFCSVREACSRGDSGARARLRAWEERGPEAEEPANASEAALQGLLQMRHGEIVVSPSTPASERSA